MQTTPYSIYERMLDNENLSNTVQHNLPRIENLILSLIDGKTQVSELYHYLPALSQQRWQQAINFLLHHDLIMEIMIKSSSQKTLNKLMLQTTQTSQSFFNVLKPQYKNYLLEISEPEIEPTLATNKIDADAEYKPPVETVDSITEDVSPPSKSNFFEAVEWPPVIPEEYAFSNPITNSLPPSKTYTQTIFSRIFDSLIYRILFLILILACFTLTLHLL